MLEGDGLIEGSARVAVQAARRRPRRGGPLELEGSLDRCDTTRISGWARFPTASHRAPLLEVWRGATLLGRCTADLYRADLAQAGLGDGCHGFRLEPPPGLTPDDFAKVVITVGESDRVLVPGAVGPQPRRRDMPQTYRRSARGRRFDRCILHIGTEKTGSTTLQAFLGRNRAALAASGYFVPRSLAPDAHGETLNHFHLASLAMPDDLLLNNLRTEFGIDDATSLRAFREETFRRLDREIATAPAGCSTLLLSNEHCHSRLTSAAQVAHLKAFLAPFCTSIEIHVYLRPQHDLALSCYGMMLMLGEVEAEMFPALAGDSLRAAAHRSYFDYKSLLDRWAKVFGHAALRPRIFQRQTLVGGSVVRDFAAVLGLAESAFAEIPDQGGNLSAAAQYFLLHLYGATRGQIVPIARRVRLADALRRIAPGQGIIPARAKAEAFMAQFAAGNEAIRRQWFPGQSALFECDFAQFPIEPPAEPQPDPALWQQFVQAVAQAR